MSISLEELKATLNYDTETGLFTWKVRTSKRVRIGAEAGCFRGDYIVIRINKRLYLAHRLAWFYVHGVWPGEQIDHINGSKIDTRIANLRESSHRENGRNRRGHVDSESGVKGVTLERRTGKWFARICLDNKAIHLGTFDTKEEAAAAYDRAAKEVHGVFARLNGEVYGNVPKVQLLL
jgi:hypothetical protein